MGQNSTFEWGDKSFYANLYKVPFWFGSKNFTYSAWLIMDMYCSEILPYGGYIFLGPKYTGVNKNFISVLGEKYFSINSQYKLLFGEYEQTVLPKFTPVV